MESSLLSDTTKCTNFFLRSPYLHNYNLAHDAQETYLIKSSVQSRLNVQFYQTNFSRVLEIRTYLWWCYILWLNINVAVPAFVQVGNNREVRWKCRIPANVHNVLSIVGDTAPSWSLTDNCIYNIALYLSKLKTFHQSSQILHMRTALSQQ